MRIQMIAGALALSACSVEVDRFEPARTVGAPFAGSDSIRAVSPAGVQIDGKSIEVAEASGPIEIDGMEVCEAAQFVLSETFGVPTSCTASGQIWFDSGAGLPGSRVVRAFLVTLRRSGASVAVKDGVIFISGEGVEGSGAASGSRVNGDGVNDEGDGAFTAVGADFLEVDRGFGFLNRQETGAYRVERVPGDQEAAEAYRQIAWVAELDVEVSSDGQNVFLTGSENDVNSLLGVSRAGEEVTIPLSVSRMSDESLTALQSAYGNLTLSYDADAGTLYARGHRSEIETALSELRRAVREPQQIRLNAAFVEFSATNRVGWGSGLSGASGGLEVISGAAADVPAIRFGTDFVATIHALQELGRTSILLQPSLILADGGDARFVSGDQVPTLGQVTENDVGERVQDVIYRDTGVVVEASASVRRDGTISVDVQISVTGVNDAAGVGGNPIFTTRSITSQFNVTSGQSVVLAGLNDQFEGVNVSGVPWLARAGVLGSRSNRSKSGELIFVVTPQVLGAAGEALFAAQ